MTVKELIEFLETQSPDARVLIYDPLSLKTEDLEIYTGYASACFDNLFSIANKKDAIKLAEEISKEEEERSGVPLVDVEKEVFYCVAFAPYYNPAVKELAKKRNFYDPDLLMSSYIEHPIMSLHPYSDEVTKSIANILLNMSEEEFDDFINNRLTPEKSIYDTLLDMGYTEEELNNGLSDEQ